MPNVWPGDHFTLGHVLLLTISFTDILPPFSVSKIYMTYIEMHAKGSQQSGDGRVVACIAAANLVVRSTLLSYDPWATYRQIFYRANPDTSSP